MAAPPAPWAERHRPQLLQDIKNQDSTLSVIRAVLARPAREVPHLLLHGPPGSGKTTTALALARELYGDSWREHTKELNASDDRGIKAVREKIKDFARRAVPGHVGFKLIILDEADSMTNEAQAALRRTMEQFVSVTRFVICCNYLSRMLDPIQSRCLKFFFKPFSLAAHHAHLRHVAALEKVQVDDAVLDACHHASQGDMRRSVTLLQMATLLTGAGQVSAEIIETAAHLVPRALVDECWSSILGGKQQEAIAFGEKFAMQGQSGSQLVSELSRRLRDATEAELTDEKRGRMALLLATADARFVQGCEEEIQLIALLLELQAALKLA